MAIRYTIITEDAIFNAGHAETDPDTLNNRTRGDQAAFNYFIEENELVVPSGDSYTIASGNTEVYSGVDNDGTITIDGTLVTHGTIDNDGTIDNNGTLITNSSISQFADLMAFDRHAGSYTIQETLNNTQKYKSRVPANANVSSLVVGLEPFDEIQNQDVVGKWGLINNVVDRRTRALTNPVITVEIDILADFAEYSDIAALKNDLEI